jgi:hypothetical protein
VEKILLIALGAGDAAGANAEKFETDGFSVLPHGQNRFLVQFFVGHDAAPADFLARQFELWLHEN